MQCMARYPYSMIRKELLQERIGGLCLAFRHFEGAEVMIRTDGKHRMEHTHGRPKLGASGRTKNNISEQVSGLCARHKWMQSCIFQTHKLKGNNKFLGGQDLRKHIIWCRKCAGYCTTKLGSRLNNKQVWKSDKKRDGADIVGKTC